MKTWISTFCLICICLCESFTVSAQVNLRQADSLFSSGAFPESGLAYAYAEYRSHDSDTLAMARIGQVKCYQQTGKYADACRVIDQTSPFGIKDSLAALVIYESLLSHYLAGEPEISISRYQQARHMLETSVLQRQSLLILTLSYLDSRNWPLAHSSGQALVSPDHISAWDALFTAGALPRYRNPETARWLSVFCPGAGQIYAGYTGSGIFNFTLHAGILALAVTGFINGYYLTAWLAGLGMFQKFFYGGIHRAEALCTIKNRQELEKYLLPVKSFLINQVNASI
ncbi:MAG: hypothetical protein PHY99_00900 [Bacteroidales bacterium]|nr:hypothetical protein [Bacteroidales bacterium]